MLIRFRHCRKLHFIPNRFKRSLPKFGITRYLLAAHALSGCDTVAQMYGVDIGTVVTQESRAVARKPRDAASILFGLKFADDIHYMFKSSQASKARLQSSKHTGWHKTEFNAKWRFKLIQSHVFWSQWKDDKALSNTI